jgi:TatD DNase family protein
MIFLEKGHRPTDFYAMFNTTSDQPLLSPYPLIDIGANLTHSSFATDCEQVLADALTAGVEQLMVTGSNINESIKAIELCAKHPQRLFSTCGIHPHHAMQWHDHTGEQMRQLVRDHACIKAIGETGLDFYRDICPREQQELAFIGQLQLAAQLKLPVFLHERDAFARFSPILTAHRSALSHVVVHCFTGEQDALNAYLDLDCYIGITGWVCDERRGQHLKNLIKHIPLNRLLIETDAPYLLPRDLSHPRLAKKSHRNEPQFLPHIANTIAQCLNIPVATLCQTTHKNSRLFFNL